MIDIVNTTNHDILASIESKDDFADGLKRAGWSVNDALRCIEKKIDKGGWYDVRRIWIESLSLAKEVSYREYKIRYSACQTRPNSYNADRKSIVVYTYDI